MAGSWDTRELPVSACNTFWAEVARRLHDVPDYARDPQEKASKGQKTYYGQHRKLVTIHQGDLVLLDAHIFSDAAKGITEDLAPLRIRQFSVVQCLGTNDFVLKGTLTSEKIYFFNLWPG